MMYRLLILVLALTLVGCGGDEDNTEATVQQDMTEVAATSDSAPTQGATPLSESYLDVSEEGQFEVRWPSGCAQKRIREMPSTINPGQNTAVDVTCFRDGNRDVGCRVTAYNETESGQPATPADVTGTVTQIVQKLEVEVWRQQPVVSSGREGVAVSCREHNGPRHVWIVGFIDQGRVMIAMAWDESEDLYNDPGVIRFMESLHSTQS